jgi:ATP-binding cassette subfamily C protein
MRLLIIFIKKYPAQTTVMMVCLLICGLLDGIGLSMLLPLLSLEVNQQSVSNLTGTDFKASQLEEVMQDILAFFNLTPSVNVIMIFIIVTVLVKSIIMVYTNRNIGYTVARIATALRLDLLRALMVARWEHYLGEPVGFMTNAMINESKFSASAYHNGVLMAAAFLEAVVFTVMAFLISFNATVAALVCGTFILLLLRRFIRKSRKAGKKQTQQKKTFMASMTDLFQSFKPLKAMGREDLADYMLKKHTHDLEKSQQKLVFAQEMMKASREPLMTTFLVIGIWVTLVFLKMPLANTLLLVFLITRVIKMLNKAQEQYSNVAVLENYYWSLRKTIKKVKQEREKSSGDRNPQITKSIRLKNVSFAYKADDWILKDASMTFPAGKISAIIGPSGSGKTTIVDLVSGLIRPQKGEVYTDDIPLRETDMRLWRRMIGYVPQEVLLLHDTILKNVTLNDPSLIDANAIDALKAAGVWDFVNSLPGGIHHTVGERGGRLSGGQRQRIAIARALVHKPKILILDEATSALDPKSEAAVCETLCQLRGKHTILAISHQKALLQYADQAYTLSNGTPERIDEVL